MTKAAHKPVKPKPAKPRAKYHRADTFNDADATEIVSRLSKGEPLAVICRDEWLPSDETVRTWAKKRPEFALAIAHAREAGFDMIAAECLTIADSPNVTVDPETKEPVVRDPSRDRLRVETRLKLLAKWDPKRYGERIAHTGADGGAIQVEAKAQIPWELLSPEARAILRRDLEAEQQRLASPDVIEGEFSVKDED